MARVDSAPSELGLSKSDGYVSDGGVKLLGVGCELGLGVAVDAQSFVVGFLRGGRIYWLVSLFMKRGLVPELSD